MRGSDKQNGALFSYVNLEDRLAARHPLRLIREIVNNALARLDGAFAPLYAAKGRPSIAPERLLRAALIQILFSVRSERQLMEQMQYMPRAPIPKRASIARGRPELSVVTILEKHVV